MQHPRESPYRQPATSHAAAGPRAPFARPLVALVFTCAVLVLAAPVAALAVQPFSACATAVTGAFAAWTALVLARIGFAAD